MIIVWDTYPLLENQVDAPQPLLSQSDISVAISTPLPIKTIFDPHNGFGVVSSVFTHDSRYLITLGADSPQSICIWDWSNVDFDEPVATCVIVGSVQVNILI
jgi:hypothetical protein